MLLIQNYILAIIIYNKILHIYIWRYLSLYFLYNQTEDDVDMMAACNNGIPMVITIQNNTDISSPQYPGSYPNNLDCTWHIISEHDKRIELSLKGYEIESEYEFSDFLVYFLII